MEIILDNASYKSKKINENLNNISYTFKQGINFIYGVDALLIKDLLFQNKETKEGYVALDKKGKKYDISYISVDNKFNKKNLYEEIIYLNNKYKLNYKNIDKRIKDALKMINLDVTYMYEEFDLMSDNEIKLSSLAIALILNSKIIILDYFEKTMSYSQINYTKKLLTKLNKMYNKNIIIFSNDLDCYLNIINNIVIFNKGSIVFEGTNKDIYKDDLYKYIDEPSIISFIKYLRSNNHEFDNYIDLKELLKAIYRDVENK